MRISDLSSDVCSSDLDLPLLLSQGRVDRLDVLFRELLDLLGPMMVLVLGDVVFFFPFLQHLPAVAAHVAHGDAPLLRVLAGDLGELDAALLGEGGDRHAHAYRKSTRLNSSHSCGARLRSSASKKKISL